MSLIIATENTYRTNDAPLTSHPLPRDKTYPDRPTARLGNFVTKFAVLRSTALASRSANLYHPMSHPSKSQLHSGRRSEGTARDVGGTRLSPHPIFDVSPCHSWTPAVTAFMSMSAVLHSPFRFSARFPKSIMVRVSARGSLVYNCRTGICETGN